MQLSVELGFNVEEYSGNKGIMPPITRSNSCTVYVATFEKSLNIIQSLLEVNRLCELGLAVFDELHMLSHGHRGTTLEVSLAQLMLHSKLSFCVFQFVSFIKAIHLQYCSINTFGVF